jgi:ribosome maturation factor RimP
MSQEIVERVQNIAEPILSREGLELVDIEYRRETRGWVLRLYIDKEGGVNVDDCSHASQEVGRSLDVEEVITTPYTLEVSSPGLDRPLKNEKDFRKSIHKLIRVKTVDPIQNQKNFKGRLLTVSENRIEIEAEGKVVEIPLSQVAKAKLEIEI